MGLESSPGATEERLRALLSAEGSTERARAAKAYMRSELTSLGASVPAVRALARPAPPERAARGRFMMRALAFSCALLLACSAEAPRDATKSRFRGEPVTSTLKTHLVHGERSDAPVVIVLHGYGADGTDLLPLAEWIGARTHLRFVVAEAPLALEQGGRAWWPIDWAAREAKLRSGQGLDLRSERPDGVDAARAQVSALVADVRAKYGVDDEHIALLGFSQGAMLSLEIALHLDRGPRCLALLSGTYLSESVWKPRFAAHRHVPVFMSHGSADPILPFANSSALKEALEGAGYAVTFRAFSGGHEIPRQVAEDAAAFLERCFAEPATR